MLAVELWHFSLFLSAVPSFSEVGSRVEKAGARWLAFLTPLVCTSGCSSADQTTHIRNEALSGRRASLGKYRLVDRPFHMRSVVLGNMLPVHIGSCCLRSRSFSDTIYPIPYWNFQEWIADNVHPVIKPDESDRESSCPKHYFPSPCKCIRSLFMHRRFSLCGEHIIIDKHNLSFIRSLFLFVFSQTLEYSGKPPEDRGFVGTKISSLLRYTVRLAIRGTCNPVISWIKRIGLWWFLAA